MTHVAIAADPKLYPCARLGCDARSIIVTATETHGSVSGHCADHVPDAVRFPTEVLAAWTA